MRNFRKPVIVLITTFGIAAIVLYGTTKGFASENHKHENVHEHPKEHGHEDECDVHDGHDHGGDHSRKIADEKDEHGHDHGEDSHEEDSHNEGVIKLSQESQKLGGIEVEPIGSEPVVQRISVNGRIAQDVENVTHVFSERSGQLTECFVALGQDVKKGDRLCVVSEHDSDEVFDVKAPVSGTIIAEFIKTGDHVNGATTLYTIADMTRLSANFDVYEKDLAHVQLGQKMNVYPIAYPDQSFFAEIVFISPRVDESTFTTRIKAVVDNPQQLLKLGMSVRGEIKVVDEASYLALPSDAVQNVEGEDVVFVQTDVETFEKRSVQIQSRSSKDVAISGGLVKGDRVVIGGAFILKSKLMESEMEHAHDH